jgi:hypothetical protein
MAVKGGLALSVIRLAFMLLTFRMKAYCLQPLSSGFILLSPSVS